jgi:hypothetical protein
MKDNVTAVIRNIGERTTDLCYCLLSKQIPEKNIFVVTKYPSTEGTRAVYEIGLREGRKWTLFVDADQLLFKDSVKFLYELAENQEDLIFGAKGSVIDKLFMETRKMGCGPIMYNTAAFEYALNFIPDPYEAIRPDSYIIANMKQLGYNWIRHKKKTALHDYFQYYKHIYMKMFINAKKSKANCRALLYRWEQLSEKDPDFKVCINGYLAGKEYSEDLAIDYTQDYGYEPEFPEKEAITDFKKYEKVINEYYSNYKF